MRRGSALAVLAASLICAAPAGAATVTVVHGIPAFPADVYVNGKKALSGFEAGQMTDPIELPAGSYRLAIRKAGSPASSKPALSGSITLKKNSNASVVGHLDGTGNPSLSVYGNNFARLPTGQTRVVFRQTAAVPSVDVVLDGKDLFTGVANDEQVAATIAAGSHTVAISRAGSGSSIWGPARVSFRPGQAYVVYAIGSPADGTLDQLVQQFGAGLKGEPLAIPSGQDGLVAPDGASTPWLWWAGVAAALAGLTASAGALLRRRVR